MIYGVRCASNKLSSFPYYTFRVTYGISRLKAQIFMFRIYFVFGKTCRRLRFPPSLNS